MIDDIILFVHIAQQRGLANAAKYMALPAATVTRRLQRLETSLKCRLINRSSRQFGLTSEGEIYYNAYAHLVEQFEQVSQQLASKTHQLNGQLNVLAPTNISIGLLKTMWSDFIKHYPDIQLKLALNNKNEDLLCTQTDIALRIGPQKSSSLSQKRLGSIATIMVAAQSYINTHGAPQNLTDLHKHKLIAISAIPTWQLTSIQENTQISINPVTVAQVNDVRLASQFVEDGVGIGLLPMSEINNGLTSSKLVHILKGWRGSPRDIFAVWPSGRLLNAKAKCLLHFMKKYIESIPTLQNS